MDIRIEAKRVRKESGLLYLMNHSSNSQGLDQCLLLVLSGIGAWEVG